MTPLFPHHEPDDRPSTGEILFAACMFLAVLAVLYLSDLLKGVQP